MRLARPQFSGSATPLVIATVFVDIVGFGMILPLLPGYADRLGATPAAIGALVAAYSAVQFVLAPAWGRVSDRYGRRPVLLLGLAGSVLSYLVFARADTFLLLLLSRILDGGSGATISVAQAYLADESAPDQRARAMGKIGAAVGLGFIVGPILGGVTSSGGYALTGMIAAGISLANLIAAWWWLPESRPRSVPGELVAEPAHWSAFARPVAVLFLTTLAFSVMYVVFPLFGEASLGASRSTVSYWFAIIGLVTAVVQGTVLGRLVARYTEGGVARIGAALLAGGFLLVPVVTSGGNTNAAFFAVLALLGAGYGLGGPAMLGMISRMSGATRQGRILGIAQSASSMSRIIGPLVAGAVMQGINAEAAFLVAAIMAVTALALALGVRRIRAVSATLAP